MKDQILKYLPWVALASLVIIQFFRIDKVQPPIDSSVDFLENTSVSEVEASLIKNACYDCHSHEVKYPWYANVAPVSFWVKGHVDNGVKKFNFSEFGSYTQKKANHKLEECVEVLEDKRMPLKSFTWLHPEARLSGEARQSLIDFFNSKIK